MCDWKKVIIALLLLAFSATAAAQTASGVDMDQFLYLDTSYESYRYPGGEVNRFYRTYFDFVFPCKGDCPKNGNNPINPLDTVGQRVEVCGEKVKVVREPSGINGVDYIYKPPKLSLSNYPNGLPVINGPADNSKSLSCPPGEIGPMKFLYRDSGEWKQADSGASLKIYPKDRASYVTVLTEEEPLRNKIPGINKPPQLYELRLTDKVPSDVSENDVDRGDIIIMDSNPADNLIDMFGFQVLQGAWNPLSEGISVDYVSRQMQGGKILDADGPNFNSVLENDFEIGENCGKGEDEPCNAALRGFDTDLNKCYVGGVPPDFFSGESCGPRCPLAHTQSNFCAGSFSPDKTEKLFTVSSSLIKGYRYPQIEDATMCPDGYKAGVDCLEYTEITLAGGPPTPEQLEQQLYRGPAGLWKVGDNEWSEPLKFHTCGKNLDLMHGKTVMSPTKDGGELYRCNANEGKWVNVNTCNDGVDNDGDGQIDEQGSWYQSNDIGNLPPDTNCQESSTEYNNECPASVVGLAARDTDGDGNSDRLDKAALYDESPQGEYRNAKSGSYEGCRYNSVQWDVNDKVQVDGVGEIEGPPPVKYWCDTGSFDIASHPLLSGDIPQISKSKIPEDSPVTKYMFKAQDLCRSLQGTNGVDDYGSEMPAAIYKVPERFIPYGTEYADVYGYAPFKAQSVRNAENKYFNGAPPTESQLKQKGLNDTIASKYSDLESEDVADAWTVANYFARNNEKIEGITFMGDDGLPKTTQRFNRFEGGLAPKCPEGEQWVYSAGEHKCREDIYHYILPDIDGETAQQTKETSMKVPTLSVVNLFAEGKGFQEMELSCWRGGKTSKPANEGPDFTLDLTQADSYPTFGFVDLTADTLQGGYDPGSYTCNTTMIRPDGKEVNMESTRWVNLWDARQSMGFAAQTAANIAHDYNLDYQQCSSVIGLPCDIFKNISTKSATVKEDFFENERKVEAESKAEWESHYNYLNSVLPEFSTAISRNKCPGDQILNEDDCVRKLDVAMLPLFYDDDQNSDFRQTAEDALEEFAQKSPLSDISDNPMDRMNVDYIEPSEVSDPDTQDTGEILQTLSSNGLSSVASGYKSEDYDKVIALADIQYFAGDPDSNGAYTTGRAGNIPHKFSVTLARHALGTMPHEMGHQFGLQHTDGAESCPEAVRGSVIPEWQNDPQDDGKGEIMNYCDSENYFSDGSDEYETLKYYMSEVISGEPVY